MKTGGIALAAAVFILGFVWTGAPFGGSQEVPRITPEEVVKTMGNPDVIIIDTRQGIDWELSREKIKGSVREDPNEIRSWMGKYSRDKTLIFYCA